MTAEQTRQTLGGAWQLRKGGWWLTADAAQIAAQAAALLRCEARFVTITGRPVDEGLRVSWHWDVAGTLLSLETQLAAGAPVPSIVASYPGADWAERELRDYYAVSFGGRDATPPLMLRADDRPGVLLCKTGEKL